MVKKFTVNSGKVTIQDPCYDASEYENLYQVCYQTKAKKGEWKSEAITTDDTQGWGRRVCKLQACHSDYNLHSSNHEVTKRKYSNLGVDSGQLGIFDLSTFQPPSRNSYDDLESYYRKACELTLSQDQWGVLENGVVSSTGYGDGNYDVQLDYINDEIVAVFVTFIEDEYEDEDEDEDDC